MRIELIIGRTWQIWLNGRRPHYEFAVHEPEGIRYVNEFSTLGHPGVTINHHDLRWIEFDVPQTDWVTRIDRDDKVIREGPASAKVHLDGMVVHAKVVEFWWPLEEDLGTPKGVQVESGEWAEVDTTKVYLRLEIES